MTQPTISEMTILAGDLGGTKTLLAACQVHDGRIQLAFERSFASAQHSSLEDIVAAFLEELPPPLRAIRSACFGVAGPVRGATAEITNLPWTIASARLSEALGGAPVSLLNDLQAAALGMLVLPAQDFVTLQDGPAPADGAIAVIAPGTGLGESLLIPIGGRYYALPMEAGHADFAATTDEEYQLVQFLRRRHGHHISYERVLCGDGLGDLYTFLRERSGEPEPAHLIAAGAERNAAISQAALDGSDPLCARALERFVEILGNEAGNAALRGLARGGVILGGGIPPKILRALQAPGFLARFHDKGRFTGFMQSLYVRVAMEPRAGLLGAAHHAAT